MKKVIIPDTKLEVSRFSFGTASLHHLGSSGKQRAHLHAAIDAGFSHFDTAPLYGFGGAERAIGHALGAFPDVTIATKVGLYPPGGCGQGRAAMLARKVAGRLLPSLSRPEIEFGVSRARRSLDDSLVRLQRDKIDLLLLHEPNATLITTDEWVRWLEDEKDRVGNFGISGPRDVISTLVSTLSPLAKIVQTRDSIINGEASFMTKLGRELQFTYGYISGDCSRQSGLDVLVEALARNVYGSIVTATLNKNRLSQFREISSAKE